MKETWAAMEGLVSQGLVRSIGVANFSVLKLQDLLATANIPPAVNQVQRPPPSPCLGPLDVHGAC